MNISIVIPNYNGEELLTKNLPKVFDAISEYKKGEVEVIVVDDASTDNSIQFLERLSYKNHRIIKNQKNLGFSSTVNIGVKNSKGDIILLLNSDVYPEKGFIENLIKHFEDEKVFAVGMMDKSIENGKTVLRGRGLGEWKRGFLNHRKGDVDQTNTLWVSGGSGAFRKSIWDKLGGFNELYNPFYWEDIDLSYRAQKSGYKILFEPKSVVVHEHEKGAIKNKYSAYEVKVISYRNQFIFSWENATDYSLQISEFVYFPYHIVKAILQKDTAFFIGFLKAFILLPKVLKSSFQYQRQFVKKDSEVIREKMK